MKKPANPDQFYGQLTVSPSDGVTRQVVITASPKVAQLLDSLLLPHGIIAIKEGGGNSDVTMRFDIENAEG